jgi:E3 ubiquitin-protein ligase HECTD1
LSFSEDGNDSSESTEDSSSPVGEILTPTTAAARASAAAAVVESSDASAGAQEETDGGKEAPTSAPSKEDAKEIMSGKGYTWREWSLVRGRDCLYIWSDAAALELSNGSNGWFRFILDGKLATMYSSGSPEGGSDSSENRGEFLEKLQRARVAVKGSQQALPVFTKASSNPSDVISVGNWNLSSTVEGELTIINSDGQQQATLLKEDLPGFLFQSNRGTRHTFTAETSLGPEFAPGWSPAHPVAKKARSGRLNHGRNKAEAIKHRVRTSAREIYENFFRAAQAKPRGVVATLANIVSRIESACHKQLMTSSGFGNGRAPTAAAVMAELGGGGGGMSNTPDWRDELTAALTELAGLLEEESTVSAFELHTSGLIQMLLKLFSVSGADNARSAKKSLRLQKQRVALFKECFSHSTSDSSKETLDKEDEDDDNGGLHFAAKNPTAELVKKLVSVLETIEKLPLLLYDHAASGYGLQILTRRLRFRLERVAGETNLIDRSGCTFKMEPLASVKQLERFLLKVRHS